MAYLFQALLRENLNKEGGLTCTRRVTYFFLTCCLHVVVPSQVYALVGSEQKGQVLGGMVAAGAGKLVKSNLLFPVFHTFSPLNLEGFSFLIQGVFSERWSVQVNYFN